MESSTSPSSSSSNLFDRLIFHVDMDSFYASCELSSHPDLKTKPFVVGADPKEGKGRGVVLACNYEARKFGLRSGMPISRAWELCPQASYVRPNFDLYGEISSKVMSAIRQFADKTEQISIDEAYLDVTERLKSTVEKGKLSDAIREHASSIKKSVWDTAQITCTIGVANSKIVAKIATDLNKPDGLTIVEPEKMLELLGVLPVSKIPGVGKVTQRILQDKFNVLTISDLRKVPVEDLRDSFGRSGLWLSQVSNGIDESEVVERFEPVSISGETTFGEDENDYQKVRKVLDEIAEDVHRRTLAEGYFFKSIGIKIRFTGFETHTRSRSLNAHSDSLDVMKRESEKMLSEFSRSGKSVRLVGVRVSGLQKKKEDQKTLLDWGTSSF